MATIIRREFRRRGFFGTLFKLLFIIFNLLMLVWLIAYWKEIGSIMIGDDVNIYKAEEATIGTSFLFFFWAAGCLILGLLTLLSRGSKIVVEEWKEPLNEVPIGARYGPPISRAKETKLIIFLIALGISAVVIFSLWKVSEYFGLFFFLRAITEHYKENKPLEEHNTARTRRSPDQAWEGRFSDALRSQQACRWPQQVFRPPVVCWLRTTRSPTISRIA